MAHLAYNDIDTRFRGYMYPGLTFKLTVPTLTVMGYAISNGVYFILVVLINA